ncbi:MAG: type II toxin-antitoxin system VapC family toxin [Phycisphaerales bacterium]
MNHRLVAIDTGILIWALRKPQGEFKPRVEGCRLLLRRLEDEKAVILLPAPSLAEYLVPYEKNERTAVAAKLNEGYRIAPVDAHAAAIAAEMFNANHKKQRGGEKLDRRNLKVDVLVLAAAKVAGASEFYTCDERLRKFAAKYINSPSLPTHDENLFRDHEARKHTKK